MRNIVFTYHVKERMFERNVTEMQAKRALSKGIEPRPNKHGFDVTTQIDGKVLRVGFIFDKHYRTGEPVIVVKTSYWPNEKDGKRA